MAVIENIVNNTLVSGTNDADTITSNGHNVTIQSHAGDDYIESTADYEDIVT